MDTIVALIEQSCKKFAARIAFLQRVDGVWRETTYRSLSQVSDGIAAGLLHSGFRPGGQGSNISRVFQVNNCMWLDKKLHVFFSFVI